MKQFIVRILFFISIYTIIIASIIVITSWVINKRANFISKKHSRYIVLGHSHPECAFNDSLINDLSNFASSGEAYFYTFLKMKKLVEQNSEIETVFIEYSNNQIKEGMNNWIWDEIHLNAYSIYYPFMRSEEHKLLFTNNFSGYITSWPIALKNNIYKVVKNDYKYTEIGGYKYLKRSKIDSILKNLNSYCNTINNDSGKISTANIKYLEKVISFCTEKGKRVMLIRSPMHNSYPVNQNEDLFQRIRKNKFPQVEFLDFKNFPLLNSEFGDLQHLNFLGARKFSIWFDKLLKDGLLLKAHKQKFIDEEFKKNQDDK